jgi:hypothetical protein
MHLLERYSLACGINPQKLGKAKIFELYYQVPFEKYIIIHASSGMPAKNYDYYNEVLDFCLESLKKGGYGIVQIGGKEDPAINNCLHLQGKTNIHQTAYLIKRAAALIGNDSFSTHMASSFGTPSVTLYSVISPNQAGPYWNNMGKQKVIMAPLKDGEKPSYSSKEADKKVNKIKPEQILKSLFDILPDLDKSLSKFPESIFIGRKYKTVSLNLVPDANFMTSKANDHDLNIRVDLLQNENLDNINYSCILGHILNRKCIIVTDKILNAAIFQDERAKSNVKGVIFKLTKSNYKKIQENQEFIRQVKTNGIPINIGYDSNEINEDVANDMKIDYMDEGFVAPLKNKAKLDKDLEKDILESFKDKKTKIRSKMIIYSKGKNFLSEQCFKEQISSTSIEFYPNKVKKTEKLLNDADFFYVHK